MEPEDVVAAQDEKVFSGCESKPKKHILFTDIFYFVYHNLLQLNLLLHNIKGYYVFCYNYTSQ